MSDSSLYPNDSEFLMALDKSLDQLSREHSVAAQIVSLRFFAGLSIEQTSDVMNISARTVNRQWLLGKAWLHAELSEASDA